MKKRTLNKILFMMFIMSILFAGFSQSYAVTLSTGPQPVTINQPVTFNIGVNLNPIVIDTIPIVVVDIDYGDGGGYQQLTTITTDSNLAATHTYSRPGLYQVRVRATISFANNPLDAATSPNPAVLNLRVTDFQIQRMELKFENNRPEITIDRNEKAPSLAVKIQYSGSGYLKGYWEVDGLRRNYVFQHLRMGPYVTFNYPSYPPLPTFTPGTHIVRFVITNPALNINFPKALYYVTAKDDTPKIAIDLISPFESEIIDFQPPVFNWKTDQRISVYLLHLFENENKDPLFSAYSTTGSYQLRSSVLNSRLSPGQTYEWQVTGFNDKDKIIGQSEKIAFTFQKAASYVPGQILMATGQTSEGKQAVGNAKQEFGFQILQQYPVKTLGLDITLFSTDLDVIQTIDKLQNRNGVVLVQPNYIFKTFQEPMSGMQGFNNKININQINQFYSGKNISVGIIDTGIDIEHKDLEGSIAFYSNYLTQDNYKGEIHGTAIAGLIGARNNDFGISGLAPDIKIYALRACKQVSRDSPKGECYSNTMIQAIDAAIQKEVNIVNMSLGAYNEDPIMTKIIEAGTHKGVIFVAPAGNIPGKNRLTYPASLPGVISVAGIMENGKKFPDDLIADKSDICAPCQNILSTIPSNEYNFLDGTSMSTAIVSGLIALSLEKDDQFTTDDVHAMNNDIDNWIESLSH